MLGVMLGSRVDYGIVIGATLKSFWGHVLGSP